MKKLKHWLIRAGLISYEPPKRDATGRFIDPDKTPVKKAPAKKAPAKKAPAKKKATKPKK
jgi:hypothetical protein